MNYGLGQVGSGLMNLQQDLFRSQMEMGRWMGQSVRETWSRIGPDPGFVGRFREQFYRDRLPVISEFSIWPIPRGATIAIGSDVAFRGFQNLAAREATRNFSSFSGTRDFIYITGYRSGYLNVARGFSILRNVSSALTLWGTAADLGTTIESAIHTWREDDQW